MWIEPCEMPIFKQWIDKNPTKETSEAIQSEKNFIEFGS